MSLKESPQQAEYHEQRHAFVGDVNEKPTPWHMSLKESTQQAEYHEHRHAFVGGVISAIHVLDPIVDVARGTNEPRCRDTAKFVTSVGVFEVPHRCRGAEAVFSQPGNIGIKIPTIALLLWIFGVLAPAQAHVEQSVAAAIVGPG
eukprot:CAMPEP_0194518562 /NCGR_PEP_ID=MMETSP0253-20130528/52016_1 /TAXON_ID=2966 /ORGANISM="Noctiluca scintillans" /LENGTH=144 /DNA_ID=CAMNT_0039362617 /DNA_START=186 /DNA_END=620 /DNA_ORIENTATION=-